MKFSFRYWKPILVSLLLFFISFKMYKELKGINFDNLISYYNKVDSTQLLYIIIFGSFAVSVLCFYDLLLKRTMRLKISNLKLFSVSYVINSFNNLLGLGGFIGAGARIYIYKPYFSSKSLLYKYVSLMLVSMLSGLSLLSYIVTFKYDDIQQVGMFSNSWSLILVIAANVFLPIFILYTYIKPIEANKRLLGIKFTLISAIEFSCASILFHFILMTLNVDISFVDTIMVFITAAIAGLVSMIPGGVGAFDIIVILALSSLEVPKELSVLSTLIYRVVYYFIPVLISTVISLFHIGHIKKYLIASFKQGD
ncbi:TIGR00374 family protein [Staphylococcus aureus]|uniref:flippase-like domain-containing protein n=1 Tax=Staphylococcus aureus TaxID=1280 RepID=UPI000695C07D|nr:flippase-like domain-containing protein [Staphylococcus aureus]MBH4694093.1 TIGR00374 family protein [Staphylococcus aureus]MBH4696941.1 TIGR00374 family protein [Staphylococcus aureus]MBH4702012.1 TIGR00374 family protein [Staphylococcus aureus]MBH4707558.1 TIGR00374 family protein [Staphylococcus aureus]MBH4715233.1 TIGR00374 family protein [Staphylococcus aureus]